MGANTPLLIAVIVAAFMSSGACLSFAQTSPLTLEETKSLSDKQLVNRAFSQLADTVVHVQRPPPVPFFGPLRLTNIQLMLRPERVDWYKGLCKADFIDLSFVDAQPYKASKPGESSIFPGIDPPVVVHKVTRTTRYRITGGMAIVRDGVPPNDCGSISEPAGFINAPNADAVWQSYWLMRLAAAQAKTGRVDYKLQCGSTLDVCIKMVADVADKRLAGVAVSCDKADFTNLIIPPTSSCSAFIMSGAPEDARAGQQWQVVIVASVGGSLTAPTAVLDQVIVAPQHFVID
jgi:hypothetical protein